MRYTTADTDVLYGGNVYTSRGPFFDKIASSSRGHWKAGLDLDTWQVSITPATIDAASGASFPATIFSQPWLTAVRVGALDGATVDIHRAYFAAWPTRPFTITTADVLTELLLHCDGADLSTSFPDASADANVVTALVNAHVSTTQSKFGGASGFLDGTSSLSIPSNSDFMPSGDYTIDLWIFPTAYPAAEGRIFNKDNGAYSPYNIYIDSSHNLLFSASSTGTSFDIASGKSLGNTALNVWSHLAVVRSGNNYFLFKDGVQTDTFSSALLPVQQPGAAVLIGSWGPGNNLYTGYVDEVRFSNTARWTSAFTPEVAAYSNLVTITRPQLVADYVLVDVFAGRVAGIDVSRTAAVISINSFIEQLQRPMPRNLFQSGCRWTLFDAGCTLSAASFAVAGTVAARTDDANFTTNLTQVSNYFALGRIVWLTGNNVGFQKGVRSYLSTGGAIKLVTPMPYLIQAGDTFTIYPGCNKTQSACANNNTAIGPAFNNAANFGGQPYIPIPEVAV